MGYTTVPPRNASPAGKWLLNVLMAVTHDGLCTTRCDRILWKSTVEPDPDSDDDESETILHPKGRTRVGQFFANFMRYRKSSYSSSTSLDFSSYGYAPPRDDGSTPPRTTSGSPTSTPVCGKGSIPSSLLVTPEVAGPGSVGNDNVANVGRTPGVSLLRSFSVDQAQSEEKGLPKHREPLRTWTTPFKPRPLSATPLTTEPGTTTNPKDDQVIRNGPARWRFLPFFRGDSSHTAVADPSPSSGESLEMIAGSTTHKQRKGDVICLGYDSLDDRAMRRLESRSDHRPVTGSFAIYL